VVGLDLVECFMEQGENAILIGNLFAKKCVFLRPGLIEGVALLVNFHRAGLNAERFLFESIAGVNFRARGGKFHQHFFEPTVVS